GHRGAAGEWIYAQIAGSQELAEVAGGHLGGRHGRGLRIACAAEDGRAVALPVEREEEEGAIAPIVETLAAFAEARQEDGPADRAIVVVRHVVRHSICDITVEL